MVHCAQSRSFVAPRKGTSEENTCFADLGKERSLALRYRCSCGATTCGRCGLQLRPLLERKTVMAGCGLGWKPVSPTVAEKLEHGLSKSLQSA